MLVREFADRHDLCEEGHQMMAPFLDRTVKEWWLNEEEVASGSWLLWLLVHVPVDARRIAKCTCDCARPVLDYVPEHPIISEALEATEAWADGKGLSQVAINIGKKAGEREHDFNLPNSTHLAFQIAREATELTESSLKAPNIVFLTAAVCKSSGEMTYEAAEARAAKTVRESFTWHEIEQAIASQLPSPEPRPASEEEVVTSTTEICNALDDLLQSIDDAIVNRESVMKEHGVTFESIRSYMASRGSAIAEVVKASAGFDVEEPPTRTTPSRKRSWVMI